MNKIKSILLKKTDKKINIISNVDKNIIGGIILQLGSSLIDASIRNKILKLNNIKKELINEFKFFRNILYIKGANRKI